MKIVSRQREDEEQFQRLRDILESATGGAIAKGSDLEPGLELRSLVTQVDITCASLLEMLEKSDRQNDLLQLEIDKLHTELARQEVQIETFNEALASGVEYDDALDHATTDFMESVLASGAAEPTFDGEISFASEVPLGREDLKPMIRTAIETWLEAKIR